MARRAAGLTAAAVKTAKPGRYGDGNGLYLLVRPSGSKFWLFRYTRAGKMREMGLGRAGDGDAAVKLVEARDKATDLHKLVRAGIDPLDQREAEAKQAAADAQEAAIRAKTFREVADLYLAAHEQTWKNPKHRMQWRNTLDTYAYPHFGDLVVADVGIDHVLAALEPIWFTKPETATRVRGRIESILDYAKSRGFRTGANPARWRGGVKGLLPARKKVALVQHHAALPWAEIGAFLPALKAQAGVSARALQFLILTAARSGEVLGARWSEIDLASKTWTVPASRMKAGKEHKVPLSDAALTVLMSTQALRRTSSEEEYVFPGATPGRPLSGMAMAMVLRRMKRGDITVHGFRSSFSDWAAERTNYPRHVVESALAHTIENKSEAAYRRGDLFQKRVQLMRAWATYCETPVGGGKVIPIGRAAHHV